MKLVLLGPVIEAQDFWRGFDAERGTDDWMRRADLVVLPAHIEHKPRRLLAAAACGVPVIASEACGVAGVDGIETVEAGDAVSLRFAVQRALSGSSNFVEQFAPPHATKAGVHCSKD